MRWIRGMRGLVLGAALALGAGARAEEAADLDREFRFASGLIEMGFPDFAERLVDRIVRRHPDQRDRARTVRAESLVARRRYADAEALLAEMPAGEPRTEATRLAIANGLYRVGETERARELYQQFFDRFRERPPTDPDVRRFFMDAAYRFGQMMERTGDLDRAVQAFDLLLRADPEPQLKRRLQVETAELMVRAARAAGRGRQRDRWLERAGELCEQVHWGGLDLWFGRTIPVMAEIEIVRGRPAEARALLRSYMDVLTELDQLLQDEGMPPDFSPMAGTRFLLGSLYEEQGDRLRREDREADAIEAYRKALTEFVNVFARYGGSEQGPDAGVRGEGIEAKLREMGRDVNIRWGAHAERAAEAQYRVADRHRQRGRHEEAVTAYLRALNAFPETERTAGALTSLLLSLAETGDDLRERAAALFIADRYRRNPEAGLALLAAGRFHYEQENTARYRWMYEVFAEAFPRHERAPAVLFTLARLAGEAGETEVERRVLAQLAERFPRHDFALRAIFRQARSEYDEGDFESATKTLAQYMEQSVPSQARAQAQYLLGDAHLRLGQYAEAIEAYRRLVGWLTPLEGTGYAGTAEELERNRELRRTARFQIGYALSRRDGEPDEVAGFRRAAVEELNTFVADYPESDMAPMAMNLVGVTLLAAGQTEEASDVFEQLQSRYPESESGRSALFALVRAAMEVGREEVARDALQRMRRQPDAFVPEQFAGLGRIMLEGGMTEEAAQAFERAIASGTEDRRILERSLFGLAQAAYDLGRYDDAAEAARELVTRYPRSGRLFEAHLIKGRAHREAGRFAEASEALRRVFELGHRDAALMNQATVELARIQLRMAERAEEEGRSGDAEEFFRQALASYQRIALLVDPGDRPDLAAYVEESVLGSMAIFATLNRYAEVIEMAEQYLHQFPQGEQAETVRRRRADARLRAADSAGGG